MTAQMKKSPSTPTRCWKTFNKVNILSTSGAVILLCAATFVAQAQTFTDLAQFNGSNGANPTAPLTQGVNGNLYGTTYGGGNNGAGTVFEVGPGGILATLYSFCTQPNCRDGQIPFLAGLVLATNGNFYGETAYGGKQGYGTIFRINPQGELRTLHSFTSTDGDTPIGGLIQGTDGNFYGVTYQGGAHRNGTVFKITPTGTLTTLHSFGRSDGKWPAAGLVQAPDGNFYGTTDAGGQFNLGTVFRITPGGKLITLHHFDGDDGSANLGQLILAADGNFYATASGGGANGAGTVFSIAPDGTFTTLYNFVDIVGGLKTLLQPTDGSFYGTIELGGDPGCLDYGCGSIFQLTLDGTLTTLHVFEGPDGENPEGAMFQATDGTLYGTTYSGGDFSCNEGTGCGTVFSLNLGLSPFVRLVRDSGKVGQSGPILGQGFTYASDVSIGGTPASFTVVSDTYLIATVPAGATTGFVTVTTPNNTLTSNKPFRVTPQLLSFDPPSGPAGTQVTITGVSLTQTQGVGFGDRVPAQFTVNSDNQVTATVPEGAQTGKIGIQTQGGTAISSATFTVTP